MSVILPVSMNSSRLCCCFLLKYWISSRYTSAPFGARKVSSSSMIALMSAMPAVVAFRWYSLRSVCCAMMDATVVLPTPDGP